jgi:hypothetical protein
MRAYKGMATGYARALIKGRRLLKGVVDDLSDLGINIGRLQRMAVLLALETIPCPSEAFGRCEGRNIKAKVSGSRILIYIMIIAVMFIESEPLAGKLLPIICR